LYNLLLFVHVVAAIAWVGGMILVFAVGTHLKAASPEQIWGFMRHIDFAAGRVFVPAAFLLAAMGVAMTLMRWEFSDLWIAGGIVGLIYSGISGARRLDPLSQKIRTLIAERGPGDPEVALNLKRLLVVIRVDVVVMVVVVALMTIKPTL
jgi:hypothetical protein